MLLSLFMLWSFPFWILLGVECCFLFWCVSYRKGEMALASLLAVMLGLQFLGDVPVFIWMWNHWHLTLCGVLGWVALSVPWAFTKWWLFVRDNSYRYDEILAEFLESNPGFPKDANQFTVEQKVDWKEYFDRHSCQDDTYEYTRVEFHPTTKQHKSDIMTWMVFWPWSLLWTLLNDPIRKLFRHIYYWMVGWLDAITARYWKDKSGHMPTKEEITAVQTARYRKQQGH